MSELKYPGDAAGRSTGRLILIGLGILLAGFLVVGTLTHSGAGQSPGFGLQRQPFLALAVLAFLGGLLSFLSPCTLPILPAYFAFAFQSGRSQIAANTMSFMLGLASMFALLGASASLLGRVLLQNQQLLLLFGGSLVLVFGAMSLLGRGFGGMSQNNDPSANRKGLWGSFVFGATFAVGWSSCVGPVLGAVLTLAAQTAAVLQGAILLFIYALGLGLPLVIVSTFFGRASRQGLFWRALRGRGWTATVHMAVVGILWALVIWRILAAAAQYALRYFEFLPGNQLTTTQEIGLLVIALAGAALWVFTTPGDRRVTLHLHSTQMLSGALFILIGLFMLSGRLTAFNSLIPPDLAIWFADIEDQIILFFNQL
jgi:cytochrome c-type biogenesis protein